MSELERVNVDGDWVTRPSQGGGGSLPTGWTQDDQDPANVDTNGGTLVASNGGELHATDGVSAVIATATTVTASAGSGGTATVNGSVGIRSAPDTDDGPSTAFTASGENGASVALDAGGLALQAVADPIDPTDAVNLQTLDAAVAALLDAIAVATPAAKQGIYTCSGSIPAGGAFTGLTWAKTSGDDLFDLTDDENPEMLEDGVYAFSLVVRHDNVAGVGALASRLTLAVGFGGRQLAQDYPSLLVSAPSFTTNYMVAVVTYKLLAGDPIKWEIANSHASAQTMQAQPCAVVKIR